MIVRPTSLQDAYTIDLEKREDPRGFFARGWCRREFEQHHLIPDVVQANISYNTMKGTLRGMHYQAEPHGEVKLIRCTRGRLYDVIIDLRQHSATYGRWFGLELNADNRLMLYVPAGFAHGFQTLEDETEAFYLVSEYYTPGAECGVRYNDPAFDIAWPLFVTSISDKDRSWPDVRLNQSATGDKETVTHGHH
jgi:dTDP-4-dehydrorhamnose 3,5-epimerase